MEKLVTVSQLKDVLMGINKGQFVHLWTETEVRMNKTGNPFYGQVSKISSRSYLTGCDYEKRVNSNMEKEGLVSDFVSEKPSGKTHISPCVLVSDKDNSKFYLMVEHFNEVPPVVEYRYNGGTIEKSMFKDWMVKVSESKKQEQDRKVQVVTFLLTSIKKISVQGVTYTVIPEVETVNVGNVEETVTV